MKSKKISLSKTVDEELKEAIAEFEKITSNLATRELYARKEEGLRDYISGLTSERRAGIKEGREQGEKKKSVSSGYLQKSYTISSHFPIDYVFIISQIL